jgi:hypothetical protein
VSISLHIPWYIFVALSLVCCGVVFFVYRYTVPPVSKTKKFFLIALRSSALLLLLFAIGEPLMKLTFTDIIPPHIALLVDNSLSMSLTDAAGNRERRLRDILSSPELSKLRSSATVDVFSFSSSLRRAQPDSIVLNGSTTDIASAFQSLNDQFPEGLKAVILITDGNYNVGSNPIYDVEKFHVPVFALGIGDTLEQKDVLLEKIVTNSIAYIHSSVPLDATVKVSGYGNEELNVSLLENGRLIGQKIVKAEKPITGMTSAEYPVHFSFDPSTVGIQKYTVRVGPLAGEVTRKNNEKSVFVKILKSKMHVVVVAGAPSADVSVVMQTLRSDPNIEPVLYVQQPDGFFLNPQFARIVSPSLEGADCLITVGFPSEATKTAALQYLHTTITSHSLPILFISSRLVDLQKLTQLGSVLPFSIESSGQDENEEQTVFAGILPQVKYNILVQVPGANPNEDVWQKLPPIYAALSGFKAKPDALVLATAEIQGVDSGPLLIARSVNGKKSFAITGYGIERWKLLASATPETESFFDSWFPVVVRWLVTREDDKRLQVAPDKEFFSEGEQINFIGQAYNENYQPIENADLHVEIKSLSSPQRFETILQSVGQGRYEGSVENLPKGEYSFTASGTDNGADLGKTEGRFSVGEQSVEFSDTKMNEALLRQIAYVSGGDYADGSRFKKLFDVLLRQQTLQPERRVETSEFELWNRPALVSVIVALFALEWLMRKRSGML